MTTELKVTEELFQQALKASGSFEIARSSAERVSMRRGFELGMQYARHHQADDATVERVALALYNTWQRSSSRTFVCATGFPTNNVRKHAILAAKAAIAAMREDR